MLYTANCTPNFANLTLHILQGFDFTEDVSFRLVEWMELLKAMGVDRLLAYSLQVIGG